MGIMVFYAHPSQGISSKFQEFSIISFLNKVNTKSRSFDRLFNTITVNDKPDSVWGYHLSVSEVTSRDQAAYPFQPYKKTGESPAIPKDTKTYMAFQHARFTPSLHCCTLPGALTSRFHPYLTEVRRLFSVVLSVPAYTRPGYSPVRRSMLSGLSSSYLNNAIASFTVL